MSSIILCALSILKGNPEDTAPRVFSFNGMRFEGIQTNEAPVKCLLEIYSDPEACTQIQCLCSEEVNAPVEGYGASTFAYFEEAIQAFCEEKGILPPIVNPISYDFSRPELSLAEIVESLDDDSENTIHIDMTGGGRDATILLALASQLFEMQGETCTLGDVLYANYSEGTIVEQGRTFHLVELMNATRSFIDYARADQLCRFFSDKERYSSDIRSFCDDIQQLSDNLYLCKVGSIQYDVAKVQGDLGRFIEAVSDYIEQRNDDQERLELDSIGEEKLTKEEKARLTFATKAMRYDACELLFASIAPSIQKSFIPQTKTSEELIMRTIEWCAKHQLTQQALCLFTEHISTCMVSLGYFERKGGCKSAAEGDVDRDLCKACSIEDALRGSISTLKDLAEKDGQFSQHYSIPNDMQAKLATASLWYHHIRILRNFVAHSSTEYDSNHGKICDALGLDRRNSIERYTQSEINDDILEALREIEQNGKGWTALQGEGTKNNQSNHYYGKKKSFLPEKNCGFISTDGDDVYVRGNDAKQCGFDSWPKGCEVEFDLRYNENGDGRQHAVNLKRM